MGKVRWRSTVAAAAVAVAQGVGSAAAQGGSCLELESRLIQIDRGAQAGDANNLRQYDVSVAQQRSEINRALAEARRAGCLGGFLIFQPRPEAKCGKLMATIDQMRANLQRLMQARDQLGGDPFALARQRTEILRALAFNRCGPNYVGNQPAPQPGGLFATLFGQARFRTWGEDGFLSGNQFGTYRTLCVRTCDGFYFPISFSTVPGKFDDDAQTCQQMCPGAEAVLYTYRNPGEDSSAMVSLSGEPYTALPNAFRFRTEYDKSCACRSTIANGAPANFTPIGITPDFVDAASASFAAIPMPHLRPVPGEDPETVADRAGDLVPAPVAAEGGTDVAGVSADGQKKIRIVGPSFYYAQ